MYTKEELLVKLDEKYKVTIAEDHLVINGVVVFLSDFRHSEVREARIKQNYDKFKRAMGVKKTSVKHYDLKKIEKYVDLRNGLDEKNWG